MESIKYRNVRLLLLASSILLVLGPFFQARAADGFAEVKGPVTGGAGGKTVTVTTAEDLRKYAGSTQPYVIVISGRLQLGNNDVKVLSAKTLLGSGTDAGLEGGTLLLVGVKNVIVRNLTIRNAPVDNITIEGSSGIWIDHCTFLNGGDGNLDITLASDYITVSWCIFSYETPQKHAFSNLIGADDLHTDDKGKFHITFHHNWWKDHVVERMPSIRWGRVHLYNNFFSSSDNKYCIRARLESEARVENNYFERVRNPWEIYSTGPDQTPGKILARGNYEDGTSWKGNRTHPETGHIVLMSEGKDEVFEAPYPYKADAAAEVKQRVMDGAGPRSVIPGN